MKVLKSIALGVLLAGASLGVSTTANAYCHHGYGWGPSCNPCNTCVRTCVRPCARPACNTCGVRLFSCCKRPVCNPCNTCN